MNNTKKKLLIPKTDVVFQALFGTKGNEKILEGLLTEILEEKVENVSLDANQVLIRETPEDKLGTLDLRANVGERTAVNIEVQLINPYNMLERILYYWAKIYGSQIKNGEDYDLLKKTISILIIDFELPELKVFKDAHTEWKLLEKRNTKVVLFKNIEIHIIEIPKWIKNKEETKAGLGNWIEFLTNPESERVKMGAKKNVKLKEACEKLEYISEDEKMRRLSEWRRKAILDERNRNRVLAEIENNLKEAQKKMEERKKKVEEKQKKIEEEQRKMEESQKEIEERKKKVKEEQRKIEEEQRKMEEEQRKIEEEQRKIEEEQRKIEEEQRKMEESQRNIQEREKKVDEKQEELEQKQEKLKQKEEEIVKGLLGLNIPTQKIMQLTGLTENEILKIKKQ